MSKRIIFVLASICFAASSLFACGQTADLPIFKDGVLSSGFDIGVNTSNGRTDWLSVESGALVMRYPGGPSTWGAVFITYGPSVPPPRPGLDLSAYQTLLLEISGDSGTSVDIGIKDKDQLDNGSETKVPISLSDGWQTTQIPLSRFTGANLKQIYVVTEFVFGGSKPQTVRVRSIIYSACPAASRQILPQFAFGGGWYTALCFANTGGIATPIQLSFLRGDGNPLIVPSIGSSSMSVNLDPNETTFIEAPNADSITEGYVAVQMPSAVVGYAVFRQSLPGLPDQEAVVLLSNDSSTTSTLIYDEINLQTAVAIVNTSGQDISVNITVRDTSGATIASTTLPMPANNKSAMYLSRLAGLSGMVGKRGIVDFTVDSGAISVMGIRFNGSAFTSIPTSQR